jgi:hypothetical protein
LNTAACDKAHAMYLVSEALIDAEDQRLITDEQYDEAELALDAVENRMYEMAWSDPPTA